MENKVAIAIRVDSIRKLMANADLAIGAGGTATWERGFFGLPSFVIVVADNQMKVTEEKLIITI
jgi:UDP-2,4-diacetamido-2,4,6-trideoxy-beta-L-altropyranose hydrolase